jgi:glycosyltransferase involved in cell wall biosynthesis
VASDADAPLRVGFHDIVNAGWTAGAHYYKNLFTALRALEDAARPRIVVLVPAGKRDGGYSVHRDLADEVVDIPPPTAAERQARRVTRRLHRDPLASRRVDQVLRQARIDTMFVSWGEFEAPVSVPLLGWIHDFQHAHLPDLFSAKELRQRDERFDRLAAASARVVLSSEDARGDFDRLLPAHAPKARVMHFVAQVPSAVYERDPAWICDEYHLPRRFVYLPNQFWIHKGHRVVVEALAIARQRDPAITVVCTGNTNDHREPFYFGELLAEVARRGVHDNFVILGWVPQAHIFPLARQSLAVLQPSSFEGWSTTVEETKSLGKAMLLSDIPVHREQDPPGARFFDPNDADALARALVETFESRSPGPDHELEQAARDALPRRTRDYAERFVAIAREAVRSRQA